MKEVAVLQQRNSCGDECDPGIHVVWYFCGILRRAGPFWIIYHKMFGEQSYCKKVSYVNSNTESLLVIAGKLIISKTQGSTICYVMKGYVLNLSASSS